MIIGNYEVYAFVTEFKVTLPVHHTGDMQCQGMGEGLP